jgi:hypothetical protein
MATPLTPAPRAAAPVERTVPALVAPTSQRINKVLQSSRAPAQRSLFLRPVGAR